MTSQKIKVKFSTSILLTLFSLILLFASHASQTFSDWYSKHIYNALVNIIGRFFGVFPFSVAEIGLYLFVITLFGSFLRMLLRFRHASKKDWISYDSSVLLVAAILLFLYTTNCGINYGRSSFSESADIQITSYTVDDLKEICLLITENVNTLANQVSRDETGIALMQEEDIPQNARNALINLGTIYPEIEGYYPVPKGLAFPYILSVQKLSGIYSPFTIEANYNSAIIAYNLPFTACHELSHLRGFMQEQEANFIAYLACILSDNTEFQYSGYLTGWIYATNQLYRTDYNAYTEIAAQLSPLVQADLSANNAFWNQYDGKIAEIADEANDTYLKANGQSDGVQSYNRMVDLMAAYYKKE